MNKGQVKLLMKKFSEFKRKLRIKKYKMSRISIKRVHSRRRQKLMIVFRVREILWKGKMNGRKKNN